MTFARRLNHVENIPQQDSAERAPTTSWRGPSPPSSRPSSDTGVRAEQTVRVEHVTVNQGGQAIVGNVTTGGRASPEKPEATP